MIKRSECKCICHTDAVALGMIEGPMHVIPCCEDDGSYTSTLQAHDRAVWNEAIEAAAKIADEADEIAAADIRKLRK